MVSDIIFWLTYLVEKIGYIGVGLSMFIESIFVPIPSELIMPFAGFIASQGKMNLVLLIVVGGIFSFLGSLPFYFIGYFGNKLVIDKFLRKYGPYLFISGEDIDRGFEIFNKFGSGIVLLGRVIPLIRSVISFPAGLTKMNFVQFSLYTIIGSTLWSGILAISGYVLGSNWTIIAEYINQYEKLIMVIGGCLILVFFTLKIVNRKK